MGTSGQAQTVCSSEGQGKDSSKEEMVAGEKHYRFRRLPLVRCLVKFSFFFNEIINQIPFIYLLQGKPPSLFM